MTEKEIKNLLDKFLKGTITKEEEALLTSFEEQAIHNTQKEVFFNDKEKKEVKNEIFKGVKKQIKPNNYLRFAIAASVTLLLGLSSVFFFNQNNNSEILTFANTSDQIKTVFLEDGSEVILNKNSSFSYINTFNNTRYLDLKGEAFFKIKRNEKKPFVVKSKSLKTKVLGTSFNVLNNDSLVSVTVATGLVEVSDANKVVLLTPNQQASYKIASKVFSTTNKSHLFFTAWFKKINNLENVSMIDIADFLEYNYKTEVVFTKPSLKEIKMSISIKKDESIKSIINKINYITDLQLTLKENNMIEVK
ncbi:FecR family protein [Polaribacter sargassicola]|uniref:FecR family protein n=1 Tax=Polaribacter sargassicola TaxID=2836891 RepID=UPI001F3B6609|nr:FecR family protein [Polaribacter sp. DS7-9]MCG1037497.1 FecR domain-containing protein [Polaribacter sp. DS7-9]